MQLTHLTFMERFGDFMKNFSIYSVICISYFADILLVSKVAVFVTISVHFWVCPSTISYTIYFPPPPPPLKRMEGNGYLKKYEDTN